MKLKKVLKDIPDCHIKGSKEIEITGISANSKLVAPGNLFIAKKGLKQDGAQFIPEAIRAGAAAIVTDIYNPFLPDVVQIIHADPTVVEALAAAQFYHFADQRLYLVGVTGTNGKTTCSYLVRHLLEKLGVSCGLIGTIESIAGKNVFPSVQTTPDLMTNYKLFHEMVSQGCQAAVMEVSSHALDQGRVRSFEFDAAIFTNLTQDHLDYHSTMENYAAAKAKLFSFLENKEFPKVAIVNIDCPWHAEVVKNCKAPILTYGIEGKAELRASDIQLSSSGMRFTVAFKDQKVPFSSSLIGRFNVYNFLAVIGLGLSRGLSLEHTVHSLQSFKAVPGRLERVANERGLNIFVDYAHTDDALKNVLQTLREIKKGRLITVFGCGGNRDKGKRPKMGQAADLYSDFTIVTSDNPRHEDPETIIKEILVGFKDPQRYAVEPDREEAIGKAVRMAAPQDIILIAGKGHEAYQIFAHQTIDFDDRLIAKKTAMR